MNPILLSDGNIELIVAGFRAALQKAAPQIEQDLAFAPGQRLTIQSSLDLIKGENHAKFKLNFQYTPIIRQFNDNGRLEDVRQTTMFNS